MNVSCYSRIKIYDVVFDGFPEIRKYAFSHNPKDNVYVGSNIKRHPIFDIFDYRYDDRFYWNIVFAQSHEELEMKLEILETIIPDVYNRRFSQALHPMIYFQGNTSFDLFEITEGEGVDIILPKPKPIKPKPIHRTGKSKFELLMDRLREQNDKSK